MSTQQERRLDPEILNAFADGELEPEVAARVVMHLADCPADQRIVDQIVAMNATIARACAGPADEPVPDRIRQAIFARPNPARPDTVRSGASLRDRVVSVFGRARSGFGMAGVAGGALALGVGLFVLPFGGAPVDRLLQIGPVAQRSPMAEALTQLATGDSRVVGDGTDLMVLATFAVPGGFCREFVLRADGGHEDTGLACTDVQGTNAVGWQIAAHAHAPETVPTPGFVPASGVAGDPIGARLDQLGAGFALDGTAEAQARAGGWRAAP